MNWIHNFLLIPVLQKGFFSYWYGPAPQLTFYRRAIFRGPYFLSNFTVLFTFNEWAVLEKGSQGHSPVLHWASLLRIVYGVISARSSTRTLKTSRIFLDIELCQLKNGYSSLTGSGTPNFFSSHFNQLIINFAWEKTDLISIVENWINKENSSCAVVFSILQFDSRGKQFGSNILTRIQLSVKIKLKKFICVRLKYWL